MSRPVMSRPMSFLAQPVPGDKEQLKALEELKESFTMKTELLQSIAANLRNEMDQGLMRKKANVPMLSSFITRHPTGNEVGEYLGLELSASTIRIYLVDLLGNGRIGSIKKRKFTVNDHLKRCNIAVLIDFLAEFVESFLEYVGKSGEPIDLGFVISFPLDQTDVNKASIVQWTKDFEITGADGKDLGELLQNSFQRRHVAVNVKAVVNSVAGCLLAQNYCSQDTLIACTISTGTNAAYWEESSAIKKVPSGGDETIINTEWGSFGDENLAYLPRTKYDNTVNRQSQNPGVYSFEKMISGLYLGELARVIMIDFLDREMLFDRNYSATLNKPYAFETSYVNRVCEDNSKDLSDTQHVLQSIMGLGNTSFTDRQIVKMICEIVCQRSARLTAAAISAIIDKRDKIDGGLTVCVEGDIYEYFSNFPRRVREALNRLYGDRANNINIKVFKNGNVIGAAVAAMLTNGEPHYRATNDTFPPVTNDKV